MIGELSRTTGFSKDTIRFYEKIGLIAASERQAGTRIYKEYNQETVERLQIINQGKGLGFTLSELRQILDEWGSDAEAIPKREVIQILERKLEEVAEKVQQLDAIKTYIVTKLRRLNQEISSES